MGTKTSESGTHTSIGLLQTLAIGKQDISHLVKFMGSCTTTQELRNPPGPWPYWLSRCLSGEGVDVGGWGGLCGGWRGEGWAGLGVLGVTGGQAVFHAWPGQVSCDDSAGQNCLSQRGRWSEDSHLSWMRSVCSANPLTKPGALLTTVPEPVPLSQVEPMSCHGDIQGSFNQMCPHSDDRAFTEIWVKKSKFLMKQITSECIGWVKCLQSIFICSYCLFLT